MTVYFYALFVHLSLNVYVFLKAMKILDQRKLWRNIVASIFIIEFALYLVGLLLYPLLSDVVVRWLWLMGSTWMVFLFYLTLMWLVIDLIFYIRKRRNITEVKFSKRQHRIGSLLFVITGLITVGIMYRGNWKFRNPSVTHLNLVVDKKVENYSSLRIVAVADLHLGYLINKKYAKKYVDLINAQNPDIILFVGDIIDAEIAPMIDQNMDEDFLQLKAPLGIYSCTGNHEYRYEAEDKIAWLNDKAKIKMIRDSAILIDNAFYVVGREDWIIPDREELKTILHKQNVDKSLPIIVLNHTPLNLDEDMEAGADIALYGHTHDGQVFPFNILTSMMFEISKGYKRKEQMHVYVTSGIGLSGPQYRIGTKSELAVIEVEFNP